MGKGLPVGAIALLFSDVEGSTRLVQKLGEAAYSVALGDHRRLLRAAVAEHGGREVDCRADELFAVFLRVDDALATAVAAQQAMAAWTWPAGAAFRARMGVHVGEPILAQGTYVGLDVNRAARICSAGHGGQVLVSETASHGVRDTFSLRDLGEYTLAGLPAPERVFQLVIAGQRSGFPALRVNAASTRRRRWGFWRPRRLPQPTLGELAWEARTLLPSVTDETRTSLAQLGASLFTAERAAERADNFLRRVDHPQLAARLAAQQEMALTYERAQHEADTIQRQIAAVDRARDHRGTLAESALDLRRVLADPPALRATDLDASATFLADATTRLDDAVTHGAATLSRLCYKLDRTRHRGVYQSGGRYIVPFVDEVGADRERDFETLTDARDFRNALRIAHKAQTDYTGPSYQGGAEAGGSGGA